MYCKGTVIKNRTGLHARPASDFVEQAGRFRSSVRVCRGGTQDWVNAKSIVKILILGLEQGESIEIKAEGEDEEDAVEQLIGLIDSGFGE